MNKKVVAYVRVSTDLESQENSLENQKLYFENYIKNHEDWEFVKIYGDPGVSGTSIKKREQFNQMIMDAENGKFNIVLCKEVSRFSRNLLDSISFVRRLKSKGIDIFFLLDGISTQDKDLELKLGIMSTLAQEEAHKCSERITWGARRSMEKRGCFR